MSTLQDDVNALRAAWREFLLAYAEALRLPKFVAWLARILRRIQGEAP